MNKEKTRQLVLKRRKGRIQIKGTATKPRLSVFRSLRQISAQIINDEKGITLAMASSKDIKDEKKNKSEIATEVGKILAERAVKAGVKEVAFDRNRYRYHGRIKALADGAREGGLKF